MIIGPPHTNSDCFSIPGGPPSDNRRRMQHPAGGPMFLSYIIVTHNRREPLLRTLAILKENTPIAPHEWEIWVVDNGSTDGTVEAVQAQFPNVRLIQRRENEGV